MSTQTTITKAANGHAVVTEKEWIAAGKAHLLKEKELTHQREAVSKMRRELPWVRVEKEYIFDTPEGKKSLSDLFDGKDQLIVYHFMYAPEDTDGCPGCSFVSDNVDSARQHFEHHDLAFVAVSRAPLSVFAEFKKRMGWNFRWISSNENTFNYDMGVSFHKEDLDKGPVLFNYTEQTIRGQEQPGLTVFFKDTDGAIYRTFSTYERGLDSLLGPYHFLDLTPKGRNEAHAMEWVRFHDRYEA